MWIIERISFDHQNNSEYRMYFKYNTGWANEWTDKDRAQQFATKGGAQNAIHEFGLKNAKPIKHHGRQD